MVGASGGGVDEAACYAGDEEAVVDLEFHGMLQLLAFGCEHLVEFFGLGHCAGKAVEDEAIGGGRVSPSFSARWNHFTRSCIPGSNRVRF